MATATPLGDHAVLLECDVVCDITNRGGREAVDPCHPGIHPHVLLSGFDGQARMQLLQG